MKTISLIGLGTGSENFLTFEAKSALENAQIIFGAKRILEIATQSSDKTIFAGKGEAGTNTKIIPETKAFYNARDVLSFLQKNQQYNNAAVVFSGDVGFFSGAASFYKIFQDRVKKADDSYEISDGSSGDWELRVIPGISSAIHFAAKLQKSWQNWKLLSLHGAKCNTIEHIRKNPACFFILSGIEDAETVFQKISTAVKNGILDSVKCWLGENLSYPDEKITYCKFIRGEGSSYHFDSTHAKTRKDKGLFVLLVENEKARFCPLTPSLSDEDFIRADKIPMTKKEVRRFSISSLSLSESSVLYDIGSGTGSITVEAARIVTEGQVFAVECKEDAFELTKKNVERFCLENVTVILGKAPECLRNESYSEADSVIPAPTHVFIGGSRGNLSEIVSFVLQKNPRARIVANFVSLENLCEMQAILKNLESENKIEGVEIIQVGISQTEKTGGFHLMKAQNPVYIISFSGSTSTAATQS